MQKNYCSAYAVMVQAHTNNRVVQIQISLLYNSGSVVHKVMKIENDETFGSIHFCEKGQHTFFNASFVVSMQDAVIQLLFNLLLCNSDALETFSILLQFQI